MPATTSPVEETSYQSQASYHNEDENQLSELLNGDEEDEADLGQFDFASIEDEETDLQTSSSEDLVHADTDLLNGK